MASISEWISNKAVGRTIPAAPGFLKTSQYNGLAQIFPFTYLTFLSKKPIVFYASLDS